MKSETISIRVLYFHNGKIKSYLDLSTARVGSGKTLASRNMSVIARSAINFFGDGSEIFNIERLQFGITEPLKVA